MSFDAYMERRHYQPSPKERAAQLRAYEFLDGCQNASHWRTTGMFKICGQPNTATILKPILRFVGER